MAGDSIDSSFLSMKPGVEFLDVLDQYSYNKDLHCTYKFEDYVPQEGDRVAIFKLGWTYIKDYVVFEWAPVENKNKEHVVVFSRHILPKNDTEMYQFCYISGENVWNGASLPFQFTNEVSPVTKQSFITSSIVCNGGVCDKSTVFCNSQDEVRKLKEENEMLRESLKAVIAQKNGHSSNKYDSDIGELKKMVGEIKLHLNVQQKEIDMLKRKITSGGEEYRKLYSEKLKVEKKYDKLKSKMEDKEKNIPDEINFDLGDLKTLPPFPFPK